MSNSEDKTVKLVVFLSDSERTRFKIACAKNRTTMSQKARQLVLEWLETEENESTSPPKKEK
ncbi:MAG: plasmid partition protein ParG [Nostoc sp. ChiQUE01a]|nr:plasmid partition protein ParG [Nostoc sp. ChiQUE01a]